MQILLKIVGEIREARNALIQVTAKLRDYLYQDNSAPKSTLPLSFAAPSHAGIIAGKECNSPAKASPHESYQGSDPQTEIQNMHVVIGTRHSKEIFILMSFWQCLKTAKACVPMLDSPPDVLACIKEESIDKLKEMRLDLSCLVGLHRARDRYGRVVRLNRQLPKNLRSEAICRAKYADEELKTRAGLLEDGIEEVQLETKAQPGRQYEDWEEEDADGIWNTGCTSGLSRVALKVEKYDTGFPSVSDLKESNASDEGRQSGVRRFNVPLVTKSTLEVTIPDQAVPSLIMRSGNKLAQISEMSGASITVIEDRPEQSGKIVQISGSPEQAEKAQSLLMGFILSRTVSLHFRMHCLSGTFNVGYAALLCLLVDAHRKCADAHGKYKGNPRHLEMAHTCTEASQIWEVFKVIDGVLLLYIGVFLIAKSPSAIPTYSVVTVDKVPYYHPFSS
ncbi:hypothetical protein ZIOFF_059524 [Zingiber officinale]|uniref:K Homology domain-containing protein n=1 Tax=Zingiber officinale TaxID=94328 RepID=A0A8J5FFC5_ZINOF|nr:hypothetical protein ZIOFF_059524 [Zingiber officinale]